MADNNESEEIRAMCSGCMEVVPVPQVHVIPHYNDYLQAYVTTYRCEKCWLPTLEATRTRLEACRSEEEILTLVTFFERYKIFIKEYRRGEPITVVQGLLLKLLDRLKTEETRLEIGPAIPIKLPS